MGHPSLVMLALSGALLGTHCSITEDQRFWYDDGSRRLREVLAKPPVERVARNVVLLVGDGMGMSTITAGRIYRGQQLGLNGEEYQLSFEKFSHIGLAKTYNVDAQVGDSAACATALFCGVKTKFHRIGVDASSEGSNCHGGRRLTSLIDWAQQEGKSTGLITNTRLTHSTPSAAYAHVRERRWESSTQTGGCKDIAQQLVEEQPGRSIDVLFGGGRRSFLSTKHRDPQSGEPGHRKDGRDLTAEWRAMKRRAGRQPSYVWNKQQFDNIDPRSTDTVLGLFEASHMAFELTRDPGPGGEPSLAEMTVKAIQMLSRNERGFLLIVEAGRIDHGHHVNSALHAVSEVAALDDAVFAVLNKVKLADTMVVVTSDHSHVFTIGGNRSARGTPILGTDSSPDVNGIPYTTLLYGNGPGYVGERNRSSVRNTSGADYRQEAAVPLKYETHGGEDVPVYAVGPWSHLFSGTFEQSYVAHAISFAACIGPRKPLCMARQKAERVVTNNAPRQDAALLLLAATLVSLSV